MTKQDLIEAVAEKAGVSKAVADECLNTIIDQIGKTLSTGGEVVLTGFGKFSTSKRKARVGRNPQTGDAIKIAASTVPKFKAGKALKDIVK